MNYIENHGQEVALGLYDLIMKPNKTPEEYRTLNVITNPFSLCRELIEGVQPMDGPVGHVFGLRFSQDCLDAQDS